MSKFRFRPLAAWAAIAAVSLGGALALAAIATGCGGSSNNTTATAATQGLWVPNYYGNTITEFTGSKLTGSGTPSPTETNSSSDLNQPWGVAFDNSGNLWSTNYAGGGGAGTPTITEYTLSQLKNLGNNPAPAANVVISGRAGPAALTFDSSGDLWVSDINNNDIVEFTPSQLTKSGSPTPSITITSASFNELTTIAFDQSGNLWVASTNQNDVLEFTPSQVSAGGSQTPNIKLATSSIDRDDAIAFDRSGNLWVLNFGNATVQEFAASSLTGSGTITPAAAVTISATTVATSGGTAQSLRIPAGLAFEKSGDLWAANQGSDYYGSLAEFTPSQLASTGSPSPKVFLDSDATGSNINTPKLIAFGPSIP